MRCEDCLDDLPSVHFVVLDFDADDHGEIEEKRVCHDCKGWYVNVMEVTE